MRRAVGGGFLPQAGEQELLRWPQQLWCLKDTEPGGRWAEARGLTAWRLLEELGVGLWD